MNRWSHKLLLAMLVLPVAVATAAPMGYSVNSDQPLGDKLHLIDLENGASVAIGSGVTSFGVTRTDIEGLALAPDSSLWGLDEDRLSLFRINTSNGTVITESEVSISGMDANQFNDFGLTFTCDGSLYATSVISQSLYQLDKLTGHATRVGKLGSMGVNVSAISSYGVNPQKIYGLGNGLLGDEGPVDNRSLYEISTTDGTTTLIGSIGSNVAPYSQAGLSFDAEGGLWAITDRSQTGAASEILRINPQTGIATVQATTSNMGFESLAVAPPAGCEPAPGKPGNEVEPIPSLGMTGQMLAVLVLLLTGMFGLRQRYS